MAVAVPREQFNVWRQYDYVMGLFLLMVLVLGATAIFSAAGGGNRVQFARQVIYMVVGFGVLLYFSLTDYHSLGRLYGLTYVFMLLLLILVRVAGHQVLGAQREINLGLFELQASEISKLLIIIVLARFFNVRRDRMNRPGTLLLALGLVAPPTLLILAQPDLGTALVYVGIFLGISFMAGVPKRYLVTMVVLSAAALPLVISRLQGYQRRRLITFLNPGSDPAGAGYNILQAKIAVGSGFVPSRVTDFIFAIFSEEWGFLGAVILLVLFGVVLVRLLRAAHLARDSFGALLAFGVATMLAFQVVINVGMNIGVMPVVGIPLPFISYGGSSMLTNMAAIGIVQSVVIHHKDMLF
jgi:rod shape determining protein RodA